MLKTIERVYTFILRLEELQRKLNLGLQDKDLEEDESEDEARRRFVMEMEGLVRELIGEFKFTDDVPYQ